MARFISRMLRVVMRCLRTALPRRLIVFPFVALFAGACAGCTAANVPRTMYDALRQHFDALICGETPHKPVIVRWYDRFTDDS